MQLLLLLPQQVMAFPHGRLHLIQVPGLLQPGRKGRRKTVTNHTGTCRSPCSAICWLGDLGEFKQILELWMFIKKKKKLFIGS